MKLNQFYVDNLIKEAISEDINYIDVSADYLIPDTQRNDSYFVAKADGVLCGLDIAMRVFTLLDDTFTYTVHKNDGDEVKAGDLIVEFNGKTACLLKGERTALNYLQRMSGIATYTNSVASLLAGTKTKERVVYVNDEPKLSECFALVSISITYAYVPA